MFIRKFINHSSYVIQQYAVASSACMLGAVKRASAEWDLLSDARMKSS